jgi:hypothetical protein
MLPIERCAFTARTAASQDGDASGVIQGIADCLGEGLTPFAFVAVLRLACDIPVPVLRDVENWQDLATSGQATTMSTDEMLSIVEPWISKVAEPGL